MAMVATELPSGYLADVWGCRKTIVWGSILGALGMLIYSFSSDFYSFVFAEIVLGIGFSFVSGADSAILYDSLKAENREDDYIKYEGSITSAGNFAEALAGVAGGLLATFSLRMPYYFQFFVACIGIPAAIMLKEPEHILERVRLNMKQIISIVSQTYLQTEMRSAIMISSFTGAATLTYAWFVQPYFQEAKVPVSVFGVLWTLLNLSAGIFAMFSYRIERWLGQKYSLITIVTLLSVGFILTAFEISYAGIAILFGFYIVRGIATPVLKDYINQYTDSKVRATILSVRNLEIRIIFAIIGPILGFLTDKFSLTTALVVCGITYFFAASLSIIPLLKKADRRAKK